MLALLKCLHHDDRGAAFVEYTALLGIILAVGLTVLTAVANWANATWQALCNSLSISSC